MGGMAIATYQDLCIDAVGAARVGRVTTVPEPVTVKQPRVQGQDVPGAPFFSLVFSAVPEPKTVRNRVHLDATTTDVQPLTEKGAAVLRTEDGKIDRTVSADPGGDEFCAFVR